MKTYTVYFSCPFCKNPCTVPFDPDEEFNEMLYADSKAEARAYFNSAKQCRNMKITRIEEDKRETGITNVKVNGVRYDSLEEALSAVRFSWVNP